jgi:hypothetical protein
MKLKTSKVLGIVSVLKEFKKRPIPGVIAFKLAGMLRPLNAVAEDFSEAQSALAKEYGSPSTEKPNEFTFSKEVGGKQVFDREKFDAYEAAVKPILEAEVEVGDDKLDKKEFEKLDLSVDEADVLIDFVA